MNSPSRAQAELFALWILSVVLFVVAVSHFRSYTYEVDNFGDNKSYLDAARAIHDWNFNNAMVKQFWGVSYAVALLSFLPAVSFRTALLLVCAAGSITSVLLAYRLWGAWIAGYFAAINFDWMQRSYLGGAEPLFVALLFGSFLCVRKQRWVWAATLAALASVVRPLGVLALLSIGLILLFQREYRRTAACTVAGAIIGGLYLLPFWIYFHDPLYQFHRYQTSDWHAGRPVGLPFVALASSLLHNREPLSNLLLSVCWIGFILAGFLAMMRPGFRVTLSERRMEFLFAGLYLGFLVTYNSGWARAEFPRFAIPLVPFSLAALEPWLPKSRIMLYGLCVICSVLAAFSAIGIRNVVPALR
jgi:hypothetical protein